MAVDVDAARELTDPAPSPDSAADQRDPEQAAFEQGAVEPAEPISAAQADARESAARAFPTRPALALLAVVCMALAGLVGWLGWRHGQAQQLATQHSLFVQVGKQAAINLTTISYTEVEADVQRVLDSSTGAFHDDFQHRAQPFIEVVKKAQSTSVGTVTEAGLESVGADQAQVLVAVTVKTSIGNGPQQDPRGWRMRINVTSADNNAKVSNVEFVP